MSIARRFAIPSDSIDFGPIDLAGGTAVSALTVSLRLMIDPGSLSGSGIFASDWGTTSGNGHGWMLGVETGHGNRNVFWFLGVGNGAYDGCGTTGSPLADDGNWHSLVVTWDVSACTVWLDGVEQTTSNRGFRVGGLAHLDLNAAHLALGSMTSVGGSLAGTAICDVGWWRSVLSSSDIALLAAGHPSCTVAIGSLLGFSDIARTESLHVVGGATTSTVSGTLTGTTAVSGPSLLTPYALEVTPSATSLNVTASVTIATAFGPYGRPDSPAILTPVATGGTISPTSSSVGTTFTYQAGLAPGAYSVTFNNDGGLNAPVVNLTINALPAQLRSARVLESGESILLQFQATSGADTNLTAITNPTINVNGSPVTLGTPIWLDPGVGQGAYPWAVLTLRQPDRTVRVVDDLDSGFTATGANWQESSGWYYAYKNQHMHFSAEASDTASWIFTGLTAGRYEVAAHWSADPSFTSLARYTILDGSTTGATLATADRSHRVGSTGLSTQGVAWSILGVVTITGTSLTVQVANAAGSGALIADAILIKPVVTPVAIQAGDAVTLTAPAGWATCATGGVNPYDGFAVSNHAGQPFAGAFQATTKRMQVGYNVEPAGESQMTLYSNLYKGTSGWGGGANQDGRGNLLPGNGGGCYIAAGPPNGVDNRGIATAPGLDGSGRWKLRYSIPAGSPAGGNFLTLGNDTSGGSGITVAVAEHTATDGKREVEYDVVASPNSNAPAVNLYATACPGHDIEIYGPDPADPLHKALTPDPTHPWNPYFLQALRDQGVKALRGLDILGTNNCSCVDFSDLPAATDDHVNPNSYIIHNTPPIASIGPTDLTPADTDDIGWFGTQATLKVTFTAPHGLRTGQAVGFGGMSNLTHAAVDAAGPIPGANLIVFGAGELYGAYVWVRSPTVVIMSGSGMYAQPAYSAKPHTWAVTENPPAGQTWYFRLEGLKCGVPPEMFLDLCARVGATPYYNIPHLLSDAAVAELADVIFAHLAPGSKIRFEYTNEHWNFGFEQFSWCLYNGYHTGYGPYSWYGYRAAQVFAIIRARAAAAGRSGDVIYVLGTHQGNTAITSYVLDGVNVFDPTTQIDEVAGATYQDTPYFGDGAVATAYLTQLDIDQMLDIAEVGAALGGSDLVTYAHYGYLVAHGRTVLDGNGRYVSGTRMINYEGGPQSVVNNGWGPDNWIGEWSHRVYTHPRYRDIALAYLQRLEDEDVFVFHRFIFNGIAYWSGGTCWATYWGYSTQPGLGDGSDGKFDNRTNPEDPRAVSVFGKAVEEWNALVAPPKVPEKALPTPTPAPTPAGTLTGTITIILSGTSYEGSFTIAPKP